MAFKMRGNPFKRSAMKVTDLREETALKHTRAQGHLAIKDTPHTHTQNKYSNVEGYKYGEVIPDDVMEELYKDPNFDDLTTPSFVEKTKKSSSKDLVDRSYLTFIRGGNTKPTKKKKDTWYRDSDDDGNIISRGLKSIGDWISKDRVRRPKKKRTRNLVTGGWNVTSGKTGRTRHRW